MLDLNDLQKIGLGLAMFGLSFLVLGVFLLFDKGLLAIGNILFLSGLTFIIGFQRTFFFFFQRHKWKGSSAFFIGLTIVFLGWPFVGMIVEMYGFILLFRGFLPVAVSFVRRIPVIGTILNLPIISKIADALGGDSHRSMV
ncbi:vesicle transport protein GOT1B-like [Panonychus citri]|uniref:vesicle transport protein GOT1B-like n=1 Tax=Panonychus citri TaxID=50023 RepID=UPI002306F44F|nr:vesicle transport protein GOT1B-like [Panonychus citri]